MLLLVHIDSVLCVEASIHPIPAAVTKSVQPDPKLNHNDNVYQHTQTHKYIKRCAKRAAVLLTAAAPLSTPKMQKKVRHLSCQLHCRRRI